MGQRPLGTAGSGKPKEEERIDFVLAGEKLHGLWTLVRTSGRDPKTTNHWMLIKRHDNVSETSELTDLSVATGRTMEEIAKGSKPAAKTKSIKSKKKKAQESEFHLDLRSISGATKKSLPQKPSATLASPVKQAPEGDDWLHEIKFDGYRILARIQKGEVQLISRNGNDWTRRFPEIRQWLEKLVVKDAVLDGEVIALADDGTSSFRNLQEALSAHDTRGLVYQLFDLLHLNGHDLSHVPLHERKEILQQLMLTGFPDESSLVRYTDHIVGHGPDFFRQACQLGLEGIISKKIDSHYRAGRGNIWLKTKCANHEEFLICGYTRPNGGRKGFGALLLGAWHDGELIYTGRVGTGFSQNLLLALFERLRELASDFCPFAIAPENDAGVRWVKPELIAEVEFTEWTRDGVLRHSSFRGLREDKDPRDIQLPEAAPKPQAPTKKPKPKSIIIKKARANQAEVAGVSLSNPDRILFPDQGITKLHLAQYYEDIAEWVLPLIANRPLSLVRCPDGRTGECFFQKHPRTVISEAIPRVDIPEKEGTKPYLYVTALPHLIGLVQAGALELHVWGSRVDKLEQPDQLVFDLDPAANVSLKEIFRVAFELKQRLEDLGLTTFPRVTGGKGLHLVVPLKPKLEWEEAKAFCRAVAQQAASDDKTRLTANMAKSKRHGKTFIDYLRNGRSATAIASYSTRARPGAPVAVPVSWDEVNESLTPNRYTLENLRRRLGALKDDPWREFEDARRPITAKMLTKVGMKK